MRRMAGFHVGWGGSCAGAALVASGCRRAARGEGREAGEGRPAQPPPPRSRCQCEAGRPPADTSLRRRLLPPGGGSTSAASAAAAPSMGSGGRRGAAGARALPLLLLLLPAPGAPAALALPGECRPPLAFSPGQRLPRGAGHYRLSPRGAGPSLTGSSARGRGAGG